MSTIEKTIYLDVPIETAYDRWTNFESSTALLEGAEIIDRIPEDTVAWRTSDGSPDHGSVRFERAETGTRVTLRLEHDPDGVIERVEEALHIVEHRAASELDQFRSLVEGDDTDTPGGDAPIVGRGADSLRTHGMRPDGISGTPPI